MASLTGPVYVPAPNPVIPRYGLFQVATGPLDLPVNARIGGLNYETSTCNLPLPYEVECQASLNEKTITNAPTLITGLPLVVYSAIRCSPVGLDEERLRKFLFDQLVAGEQAVVENTFSTSTSGLANGLGGNPALVNLGVGANITRAVAMLETWLYARYGLPGVIHAPMHSAAYFAEGHLVEKDKGGIWRTNVGTAVSFGNYAGSGPTGQAATADEGWIYITGQVAVYRTPDSELMVPRPYGQLLNRSTNVITSIMEREYVVTFDCFVAAVHANFQCCGG